MFPRLSFLVAVLAASPGLGQDAKSSTPKPPDDPNPVLEMTLSPAREPVPALRYRLIPRTSDLNPGNAAPLYLRIRHEMTDPAPLKEIDARSADLDKPLAEFPKDDVRKLVDSFSARLKQIEFGANRQTCDWAFSLPEQRSDVINILLPDVQEMRRWARLLSLKARLEVVEGKYEEAVKTLQTGIAFGRHVSENPFVIGSLVGVAISSVMLQRTEELIQQPGAPNLYWALSALPHPLIEMRSALEQEERFAEDMVPELMQVDRTLSPGEWTVRLSKMHANMKRLCSMVVPVPESIAAFDKRDLATFRKETLPTARKYLSERMGVTTAGLGSMNEDEIVARYVAGHFREVRDNSFKATHLPYREAEKVQLKWEADIASLKEGPLAPIIEIMPMLGQVRRVGLRQERKIAALRVIEALRTFAASHQGALPKTLDEITEVPVPIDPATEKPFQYQSDGKTATLFSPLIDNAPKTGVNYKITIRP